MRNNNVACTNTPPGCRLPSSRLCVSGFFEYSSSYPRPPTYYFPSATDQDEKNCTRIASAKNRVSLESYRRNEETEVLLLVSRSLPFFRVERQSDETSNSIEYTVLSCTLFKLSKEFVIREMVEMKKSKWKNTMFVRWDSVTSNLTS